MARISLGGAYLGGAEPVLWPGQRVEEATDAVNHAKSSFHEFGSLYRTRVEVEDGEHDEQCHKRRLDPLVHCLTSLWGLGRQDSLDDTSNATILYKKSLTMSILR